MGGFPWEQYELEVLRDWYPDVNKCLELLRPHRTRAAILRMAHYRGFTGPLRGIEWCDWEDEYLRRLYPIGGWILCKEYMVSRNRVAILSRKNKLGIRRTGRRYKARNRRHGWAGAIMD